MNIVILSVFLSLGPIPEFSSGGSSSQLPPPQPNGTEVLSPWQITGLPSFPQHSGDPVE